LAHRENKSLKENEGGGIGAMRSIVRDRKLFIFIFFNRMGIHWKTKSTKQLLDKRREEGKKSLQENARNKPLLVPNDNHRQLAK